MNGRFVLFIYKGSYLDRKEKLLKTAALSYGADESELQRAEILRGAYGKPSFSGLNIHFSISHSENLWACLMGPACCGLDVQYIKPCNFRKIAGRFFSLDEQKIVEKEGQEGFFRVWTAKEAYGKYTGEGFFFKNTELLAETAIKEITIDGEKNLKCAVCIPKSSAEAQIIVKELEI